MEQRNPYRTAALLTIAFFVLIYLYVQEFPILSNTVGGKYLVIASMVVGLLLSLMFIFYNKTRFQPYDHHRPDITFIIVCSMFFAPLLGSWLNRSLGTTTDQSFKFISEKPFYASGYGVIKGEKMKVSGYHLLVKGKTGNIVSSTKNKHTSRLQNLARKFYFPLEKGFSAPM
ncbi:MAG: hypothetical protein R2778_04410 [Saprospiraceae bacterium]